MSGGVYGWGGVDWRGREGIEERRDERWIEEREERNRWGGAEERGGKGSEGDVIYS